MGHAGDSSRALLERSILGLLLLDPQAGGLVVRESPISDRHFRASRGKYLFLAQRLLSDPCTAQELRELLGRAKVSEDVYSSLDDLEGCVDSFDADRLRTLIDELVTLDDAAAEEEGPVDPMPKAPHTGQELLTTSYPELAFAINPYFPRGEVIEVSGACGIFKSTAMLSACLSVATGQPWCGHLPLKGKALFVTMEDIAPTLARRVKAWLRGLPSDRVRKDSEGDINTNLLFLSREDTRAMALTYTQRGETSIRPQVIERIRELSVGCDFLVLETAARLHVGAEDNESLSVFASALEEVATTTGAAVALVRHVAKEVARKQLVDAYSGRGGASLSDAARSILVMTKERVADEELEEGEEEGRLRTVKMTHVKSTHTAPGPALVWKPVPTEEGVYLQKVNGDETLRHDMRVLQNHIEDEDGLSRRDIKCSPPEPLTQRRALAALDELVAIEAIHVSSEQRGKRANVSIYYGKKSIGLSR